MQRAIVKICSLNIRQETFNLASGVIQLTEEFRRKGVHPSLIDQLVRCSSSVGANYRASQRAKSTKDFIYKLKIVEEECDETIYFLELVAALFTNLESPTKPLIEQANQILAVIVVSIKTASRRLTTN